jgi:hypothetical protein
MGLARVSDLNSRIVKVSATEVLAPIKVNDLQARMAYAESTIPFKVRFTNIEQPGYSPLTVPPIGVAVIGYSNYIL